MNRLILIALSLWAVSTLVQAQGKSGDWNCSVALTGYVSDEVGRAPNAYLWIAEGTERVKFAVLAQQNMTEEALLRSSRFRKQMRELGGAIVWVAPWFSQNWSPQSGCQQTFEEMMVGLAGVSGHPELATVPIVPFGHSAQATFPWNFAAWNNDRTLCILSFHGDAPRTNLCGFSRENVEWGRTRNIDGIPGLMIEGEYEWWNARVRPALAFQMMYPGACISFLCDAGSGHFDLCEATIDYISLFIRKACEQRLQADGSLKRLNPADGWRYGLPAGGETEGATITSFPKTEPAPWNAYRGDPHESFWYFDEEMARLTAARYAETDGKRGGKQEFATLDFTHLNIGDTFTLEGGREYLYISGPIRKVSDRTFQYIEYDCGTDNPKRSHNAWVAAVQKGTPTTKRMVQPIRILFK